jgi:chemotaxis protein CheX
MNSDANLLSNEDLLNPFIKSTIHVLQTMAQINPRAGQAGRKEGNRTWGTVTGIIAMAGDNLVGNLVISFETECILSIVSKMLMEPFAEINDDVVDAVGEITNMIAGGTKQELSLKGWSCNMATPLMITGKDVEFTQSGKGVVVSVPFETEVGSFVLEASLSKRT